MKSKKKISSPLKDNIALTTKPLPPCATPSCTKCPTTGNLPRPQYLVRKNGADWGCRYNQLFPAGQAVDRVRGATLPAEGPELDTLEEAFTSESWIVRIYKVRKEDNLGRDHASARAFERGLKKRRRTGGRKGRRLRVE